MLPLNPVQLGASSEEPLPAEFNLSTWNVWFDRFRRGERNVALLQELQAHRPHVMLFQEVTPPFVRALQAAEWLKDGYWLSGVEHNEIGAVMAARVRCHSLGFYPLTSQMGRRLLVADFGSVRVATAHFESNRGSAEIREIQFKEAQEILGSDAVLAGDFNCEAGDPESVVLRGVDAWTALKREAGYTLDSERNPMLKSQAPTRTVQARIDRLLCYGLEPCKIRLLGTASEQGLLPSDHFGLLTTLKHS